jgi:hypothetical protein
MAHESARTAAPARMPWNSSQATSAIMSQTVLRATGAVALTGVVVLITFSHADATGVRAGPF